MKTFKQHIFEKLKVTKTNFNDDPQVIWDKILTHKFFMRTPRFYLERIYGDDLPKVNDSSEIHDDYKGTLLYIEVGMHQNKYMLITLEQHDGNFTFRINKVKTFLELFNIEVLEKILEYLDYLEN